MGVMCVMGAMGAMFSTFLFFLPIFALLLFLFFLPFSFFPHVFFLFSFFPLCSVQLPFARLPLRPPLPFWRSHFWNVYAYASFSGILSTSSLDGAGSDFRGSGAHEFELLICFQHSNK